MRWDQAATDADRDHHRGASDERDGIVRRRLHEEVADDATRYLCNKQSDACAGRARHEPVPHHVTPQPASCCSEGRSDPKLSLAERCNQRHHSSEADRRQARRNDPKSR